MSSRRVLKAAQAIREVVGMAIIAELKDPRIKDVTVTMVEVTPDMRNAKVHVSIMGDETKQKLGLRGLQSSAGYLQQKVGRRIDTRYTPRIEFVLDEGLKHALTVTRILEEVLPRERAAAEAAAEEASGGVENESGEAAEAVETTDVEVASEVSLDSGTEESHAASAGSEASDEKTSAEPKIEVEILDDSTRD